VQTRIICLWLVLCGARTATAAPDQPHLANGGFESWRADGTPEGWVWGVGGNAKATLTRDEQVHHKDKASARLSSQSAFAPHVYGGLQQQITALEPGRLYRIRLWVRGQDVGTCWVGGGPGWHARTPIPCGTYEWQPVDFLITAGADERAWDLRINVDSTTQALWIDDVTVERIGPEVAQRLHARLDALAARLPQVKASLESARTRKLPVDYPELKIAVVDRFIGYGHEDVKNNRIDRAERIAEHLERLMDEAATQLSEALHDKRPLPPVPRYVTSRVDVAQWHFEADTEIPSTGSHERRPVFFNGYGHFPRVVTDLPCFRALAANIIQIESGPSSTVRPDLSVDLGAFDGYIMSALNQAARDNIMVCVLMSPHYFPDWAYQKWPFLGGVNGGFIRFAIDAPESRQVHQAHLRAASERMKGSPALHSICLSNEPIYIDSRKDQTTQRMWLNDLKQRHGTIARLNERYGSKFPSFEDVAIPPPRLPVRPKSNDSVSLASYRTQLAVLHDWVQFNNRRFSGWHQWMGQVVHGAAPDVRIHAKIMTTIWDRDHLIYGVDPEQFCRLSNLNGNDSYNMINRSPDSPWACSWRDETMFYDLEASMRTAPVVNTEDHLIVDRDQLPVPAGHTYTVLWQAAIHRLGASMVWVWDRTYDRKSDFEGSILHRPENVEAAGRAHLDLMRLSEQVVALQNAPRPVALLYSITAMIPNGDYQLGLRRVYDALNFSGIPLRFLSENQLKSGLLDGVKVLILPRAVNSPPGLREAAARFAASGGRLLLLGDDCLSRDEYGHPLTDTPEKIPQATLLTPTTEHEPAVELRERLMRPITTARINPAIVLTGPDGQPVYGIEWQSARYKNRVIVTLVNLTKKTIRFGLSAEGRPVQAAHDLISIKDLTLPIEAKPLEPMLLELR
jgi:hypothetical protein